MKKYKILLLIFSAFCMFNSAIAQSLSPTVLPSTGGYFSGGGNTLSWTLGETFSTTLQNGSIVLTQGEQQPYILLKILNVKAFIQGFYTGGGQMTAVLNNYDPLSFPSNACDTITVELHDVLSTSTIIASKKAILLTDGNAYIQFPSTLINGSYYLVLRHRYSIETWSKNPVSFTSTTITFDFTSP